MRVNLRQITRSQLNAAVAADPKRSVRRALATLTRRAVLLQEADRSGLGGGLPKEPIARAKAFLERVISGRVICDNVTQRELRDMYAVMKRRFVHGDIYRVAELRWHCTTKGEPEGAQCIDRALTWAERRWLPLVDAVSASEDLYWLGQLTAGDGPIRFVEYTFHVDPTGKSPMPPEVVLAIRDLSVGQAHVSTAGAGTRIQLLVEHRPPLNRLLDSPGVVDEIRAELCPRLIQRNRQNYVDTLVGSASVDIKMRLLPAGHDVPSHAVGP